MHSRCAMNIIMPNNLARLEHGIEQRPNGTAKPRKVLRRELRRRSNVPRSKQKLLGRSCKRRRSRRLGPALAGVEKRCSRSIRKLRRFEHETLGKIRDIEIFGERLMNAKERLDGRRLIGRSRRRGHETFGE